MKQQNPWRVTEIHDLHTAFKRNPNVSTNELCALFPRHTRKSIWAKCSEMELKRPEGLKRHGPAWGEIAQILGRGPMTRQDIAKARGCTESNVRNILARMSGQWHVVRWLPTTHYTVMKPVIGLGAGKDAPYPKVRRKKAIANPFLVAAGLVAVPAGLCGRVVSNTEDELEAA